MKTIIFKYSQWFVTVLLMTICLNGFSQKEIIWKGGTPGKKNDWYCPQNWSTSSVPDEFSNVIIPDVSTSSFSLPIIRSGSVEVNAIWIFSNSSLTIDRNAILIVLGNAEINVPKNIRGEGNIVIHENPAAKTPIMIAGYVK